MTKAVNLQQLFNQYLVTYPTSQLALFDFHVNDSDYTLLYKTSEPEILFAKVGVRDTLKLPIDRNFNVKTYLGDQIGNFKEFFNIPNGFGPNFSPSTFFLEIDARLRLSIPSNMTAQQKAIAYDLEEQDRLNYGGIIRHKANHYTQKNRDKVEILLPDIFQTIQGQNISIKFIP
ncbi:hypothetical protein IL308_11205 [Lactococcus lactis]|uniref:DUF6037 family protein n=1 Tax=Lactococcus lactis TaxID=1358 RepID=UPI001912F520|nr:DUF6037 family protein [Lactococcus lactis]MBK5077322.1 hypothetical protein [Lactococcus lactis]